MCDIIYVINYVCISIFNPFQYINILFKSCLLSFQGGKCNRSPTSQEEEEKKMKGLEGSWL